MNAPIPSSDFDPRAEEIEQIARRVYSTDRKANPAPRAGHYASKLEAALDHAANGLPVFPVKPDAKSPVYEGWQVAAMTADKSRIVKWWKENPDYNIGTPCNGLLVVDIDPRNGGSPDALRASGLLPDTWVSRTQGGGWHYIYRLGSTKLSAGTEEPHYLYTLTPAGEQRREFLLALSDNDRSHVSLRTEGAHS